MAAKRPSFQFYSADWLKDPAVRSVSLEARGLWIDMLCLMDQSPRRGYLQLRNGKPMSTQQLARMTGCSADEASRSLQELIDSGVCYSTDTGIFYSKRMVRDEHKRELCREAGKKGGNPTLKGHSNGEVKGDANPNLTPSSSSSSSYLNSFDRTCDEGGGKKWEFEFACLVRIEAKHLSQPGSICSMHRALHEENPAAVPADEPALLKIFAAAAQADTQGQKNKPNLFRWLVSNPSLARIEGAAFATATAKLSLHREQIAGGVRMRANWIPLCDELKDGAS